MKKSINIKSNNGNNIFHEIFMHNEEDDRKSFLEIILYSELNIKYIRSKGLLSKFRKKIKPSDDYEEVFLKFENIDFVNSIGQKPYELSRRFPFEIFKNYLDKYQTKIDKKKNENS